jgi:hypothetical protein
MGGSLDPIANPSAYQQHLLSLLGNDGPARVQGETPAGLRALVEAAGPDLRRRPAPKEWSVLELLGHVADAEMVVSGRYRWALAHDRPPLLGYDQDLWVERLRHNEDDPEELLALFKTLREVNLRLWGKTAPADRARVGMHAERGPESFDLMFRLLAGHDRFHMNQIRETLRQLRSVSPPAS